MKSTVVLCYISQIRWPSAIPAGPFNANFVSALASAGVETHLVVRSAEKGFEGFNGDGLRVLKNEYGINPPENLHIHVLNTPDWKPANDRYFFFARAGQLLKKLQWENGVNAVMSRDTRALPFLARWRRRGLRAYHDSHNFYMDLSVRDDGGNRSYEKLENRWLPELDGIIPLLNVQGKWYEKSLAGRTPVFAANPGLNEVFEPEPNRFSTKTIGYVGSLQAQKGAREILEAFAKLEQNDAKLLLIGGRGKDEVERVRNEVNAMGIGNRVEITGWISVPELAKRLREVSVAVLPLQNRFYNRYLTAPSKLFDYLAHSIPVIASDLPAIRELAGNAAHYVAPGDVNALANAMSTLLNDQAACRELTQRAHARAKSLLWIERGRSVRELLESTM